MRTGKTVLIMCMLVLLAMTGCKKILGDAAKKMEEMQEAAQKQAAGAAAGDEKLELMNKYTKASNEFVGSLREDIKKYIDQKYGEKGEIKDCRQPVSVSSLKSALQYLGEARQTTAGGSMAGLESATDELIKALTPFKETVEALDSHVKSKGFLEDKGAFIKGQDAKYVEQAAAFLTALDKFEQVYEEVNSAHEQEYIKSLRAQGMDKHADIQEIYVALKAMLALYNAEEDFKNDEINAKADAAIDNIAKLIENYSADIAKDPGHKNIDKFKEVEAEYNKLLGQARQFRSNKHSAGDFEKLVKDYNHFVGFTLNFMWTWN